ncbi:MAG: sulfur carrier protein ThiS adenylyltransferase ThiF [Desulfuromonas sp.]|nr:sulfur carrier protein ThiS adenylyltransferase ThiF [Desulfuromonas sp.]
MHLIINEISQDISAQLTIFQLRDRLHPTAEVIIHNGVPAHNDCALQENDRVVFIKRGHAPSASEFDSLLAARHTESVHNTLKQATVGIAGAGGLGSAIASALTRVGIGKIIIADFDVVEPSNLNRQQYFIDQIGLPKVEALHENLRRINPFITICPKNLYLTRSNIPEIFAGVDVMVEAFDSAENKAMLAQLWLQQFPHTPLVAASGMAGYASNNIIRTQHRLKNMYLCGDGISEVQDIYSLMAPRVGIVAHHQANCVIQLLLGVDPDSEEINYADNS